MPIEEKDFEFPEGRSKPPKFTSILDGKKWRITVDEFDYDKGQEKALIQAIKSEAKRTANRYVKACIMGDNSIIVQLQPADYKPKLIGRHAKAKKQVPINVTRR